LPGSFKKWSDRKEKRERKEREKKEEKYEKYEKYKSIPTSFFPVFQGSLLLVSSIHQQGASNNEA